MEETIKKYLNIEPRKFVGEVSEVRLLTGGNSSNHDNYKVTGKEGSFVFRLARGGDLINQASLSDEYTILKMVESYNIAPRVFEINLEWPHGVYIIEEYFEGKPLSDFQKLEESVFDKVIHLIVQTSEMRINEDKFPFKFSYSSYVNNFKSWESRLEEIMKSYPDKQESMKKMKQISDKVKTILQENEDLLSKAPREFVYNDVHPGNIFLNNDGEVKFIDWQKVSLGDPSFMIALLVKRFSHLWGIEKKEFRNKVVREYLKLKQIDNLDTLIDMRILERTVADMWWVVRESAKKGEKFIELEDNKHYREAEDLLSVE
jgi:thiamine kinase-like enzyme